jgi:hypothetical protein
MKTIPEVLKGKYGRTKPKSIQETLERILWLLSQKGVWAKKKYGDKPDSTNCCLMGAARQVDGRYEDAAKLRMDLILPDKFTYVEDFNDNVKTKVEDVKAFLKHAIKNTGQPFKVK